MVKVEKISNGDYCHQKFRSVPEFSLKSISNQIVLRSLCKPSDNWKVLNIKYTSHWALLAVMDVKNKCVNVLNLNPLQS